ncbi:MAG TPA: hypothetical protein VK631_14530 [Solirubrobacteraceae bacterium]|nr:hypothetical protein [Solirubrobacteraceae bacterium]
MAYDLSDFRPLPLEAGEVYVTWDDPEIKFPAVVDSADSQLWNGFASPGFRRDVVDQLVAVQERLAAAYPGEVETLLWAGDEVVLIGADEPVRYAASDAGRYYVGAWNWTWSVTA